MVFDELMVRPAEVRDISTLALVYDEGFGHEFGLRLPTRTSQRLYERMLSLPPGLDGVTVIAARDGIPIATASLRVGNHTPGLKEPLRIAIEELGLIRMVGLALWMEMYSPPNYKPTADEAYISNVIVTTAWRGKGVGTRLLQYLHAMARQEGKRRTVLEVMATNDQAQRFYERHGYTNVCTRAGLLTKMHLSSASHLVMHKSLRIHGHFN